MSGRAPRDGSGIAEGPRHAYVQGPMDFASGRRFCVGVTHNGNPCGHSEWALLHYPRPSPRCGSVHPDAPDITCGLTGGHDTVHESPHPKRRGTVRWGAPAGVRR